MMTEYDETRQEWVTWISITEVEELFDHMDLQWHLMHMLKILSDINGEKATPAPNTIAIQFNKNV